MKIVDCRENHISIRRICETDINNHRINIFFRPGNRTFPNKKSYRDGQLALIKILNVPGSDYHMIEPIHFDESIPVRVLTSHACKLSEIESSLFQSAGPEIKDHDSLRFNLANIYNFSYNEVYSSDFIVTYTLFEYLNKSDVEIDSNG